MNTVNMIVMFLVAHELSMFFIVLHDRKNFAKMREIHQKEIFRLNDLILELKRINNDFAVKLQSVGNNIKINEEQE